MLRCIATRVMGKGVVKMYEWGLLAKGFAI
jgi:hypothetical protein